jgi:arsenical pump membrane protein
LRVSVRRLGVVGSRGRAIGGGALAVGGAASVVAAVLDPSNARAAASQDWPPFVLVAGLLLIGVVANDDGLFAATGNALARRANTGVTLFIGAAVLLAVVTAVLNLDTAVAFLTPVLVYAGRRRGEGEVALLAACILLANAGSLLLPGSNLTNLIVLGHLHLSGRQFLSRTWLPTLGALAVTAAAVAGFEHREIRVTARSNGLAGERTSPRVRPLSLVAVTAAAGVVLVLRNPAPVVVALGVVAVGARLVQRRDTAGHVLDVIGAPVLIGLFGVAVALGTLGRTWSGPASLLSGLGGVATAALAGGTALVVNNLPAASLLAARPPGHPYALLVGLNLGPNVFVTGSLAWFLWWRAARLAGTRPPLARVLRIGVVAAPVSIAVALGALVMTGGWR